MKGDIVLQRMLYRGSFVMKEQIQSYIAGCVVQGVGVTQDAPQTVLVFINIDMQYWYSQT